MNGAVTTEALLAEIHRLTGRGDGHKTLKETAGCIVSAVIDFRGRIDEQESELRTLRDERATLRQALLHWHGQGSTCRSCSLSWHFDAPEEHTETCPLARIK